MWVSKVLGQNWKSNLIAIAAVLLTVQPFMAAITQWMNHQPVDWRQAAGGTLLAILAWVVKDASTHSTPLQVQASGAAVKGDPKAPEMMKLANEQVDEKPSKQ